MASAFACLAGAVEGRPVYCLPLTCASFSHAWAVLAVTQTSLGVPQDCWFDVALLGAQVLWVAPQASPPFAYASARLPAPFGRRGVLPPLT
jgi:hypothetical protein